MNKTANGTSSKWGVIYCPKEGSRRMQRRWRTIRRQLDAEGLAYDFVQSESRGSVERLAAMFTQNGYGVILVVGGDAAMNDAINGIMAATPKGTPHPALGILPNGYGNDFARFWGAAHKDYRQVISALLSGHRRLIDVGRAKVTSEGKTTTRYFLNCINIGVAASITSIRRKTRRFWGSNTLSYLTSALLLLFRRLSWTLHFKVNTETVERKAMTACIGSATGYGQTPSAVPYNGLLDVSVVKTPPIGRICQGIALLLTGRFLAHRDVSIWRTKHISFTQLQGAPVSFDGRVAHYPILGLDIDIMPEEIEFLIP